MNSSDRRKYKRKILQDIEAEWTTIQAEILSNDFDDDKFEGMSLQVLSNFRKNLQMMSLELIRVDVNE